MKHYQKIITAILLGVSLLSGNVAKADYQTYGPIIMGTGAGQVVYDPYIPPPPPSPSYGNPPVITGGGIVIAPPVNNYVDPGPAYYYQQPVAIGPNFGPTPPVILSAGYGNQAPSAPAQASSQTNSTTSTNTITKPANVTSLNSTLTFGNGFENICPGQEVNYTLGYKNTNKTETLSNVVLRVIIPEEITFLEASAGSYSERDGTLTIFIGTLTPGASGVVYIKGVANEKALSKELIVTRSELSFTLPSGKQDVAVSYVFNNGANCGTNLGAFAFGAGIFPHTFWGWLILVVIICAIIYLARKLYRKDTHHGAHAPAH